MEQISLTERILLMRLTDRLVDVDEDVEQFVDEDVEQFVYRVGGHRLRRLSRSCTL